MTDEARATEKAYRLRHCTTRTLLEWLHKARKIPGGYDPTENDYRYSPKVAFRFTCDEIKTELATRPHLPRAAEKREARQQESSARGRRMRKRPRGKR
jgi:hypothetical protein